MKKFSLSNIIILLCAVSLYALDTDVTFKLHLANSPLSRADGDYIPMILDIEDTDDLTEIENQGIHIWYTRDKMALAAVPRSIFQQSTEVEGIRKASIGVMARPHLNIAVPDTRADIVIEGRDGLQHPYTGNGILVGLSDIGFDATHPAFTGRIAGFSHYNLNDNTCSNLLAEGDITDCPTQTHATHVCGILAGDDPAVPYKGVARGSMIYSTTSETLYDANILCGVEEIIRYGKEHDLPTVINLSLGTTLGPHDGTGAFTRYLDLCANDATILLSAGNEGSASVSARKKFSENETSLSVGLSSNLYDDLMKFSGSVDIWGDTGQTILMKIKVWDITTEKYLYSTDWIDFNNAKDEIISFDFDSDPEFSRYFKGNLISAGQIDHINGRYNIGLSGDFTSLVKHPTGNYSNVRIVLELSSAPESGVWVYVGGNMILSGGSKIGNITGGNSDHSISDMATGFHTICVGSATTRVTAPNLSGGEYDWSSFVTLDEVSRFSAYGTLADGRHLPHFCAPGAYIISAANSKWVESGKAFNLIPTESTGPYIAECGTSMSSPHAAGIMALWLEANPELTPEQLRQIAIETAVERGVSYNNPRTGAGLIDALYGIRKALKFNGVTEAPTALVKISRLDGRLSVEGIDESKAIIELYDLAGRRVRKDALPDSPVIVRITTDLSTTVRKI